MKFYIYNLLAALLLVSCQQEKSIEVQNGTLINDITVISAHENGVEKYTGFVVIDGNKIVYADSEKPTLKGIYQEIDASGKYLMSGLMDSHVHLANTAGFNGKLIRKYPELVEAYYKQLPRSYLYHGFTTLVDVNNYAPHIIDQLDKSPLHPDIYTCGNQVQVMNDFNMEMEEYSVKDRYEFPFLYDPINTNIDLPDSIDLANHTPAKMIANIKKQKGIGVKLAYEDEASGLMVSWAKPSLEIISDLVNEAKKESIPLLLHAPSLEGHQMARKAGVDIYAHGLWNWTDNFEKDFHNKELGTEHREVLSQIAEEKRGYQLTFRAITGEEDLITAGLNNDPHLKNVYPKKYLEILNTDEGNWGRHKILRRGDFLERTNPPFFKAMKGNHSSDYDMWVYLYKLYKGRLNKTAKFLAENKANFILGSDTPAMNMSTNPPGYNGFLEMKHMYDAGISLEEILRAATFNNAKAFHLESLYGGVEKGKKANLLILKSDPLINIKAYDEIEIVIIGGKIVERRKLSAVD